MPQRVRPLALHDRFPCRFQKRLEAGPRERPLTFLGGTERRAADRQHQIAEWPRIANGHHGRLHEAHDALARGVIAPRLEPVRVRQHQVGERRRLVGPVGEAHDEPDLLHRVGELESPGEREGRIHVRPE